MTTIIVATDSAVLANELRATLESSSTQLLVESEGRDIRNLVGDHQPDLLITDYQVGSMGGVAITMDVRLEQGAGRMNDFPVLLLCDRRADVFMARRAQADGIVMKPINAMILRKAVRKLLDGDEYFDTTGTPESVSESVASK